MRRGYVFRLLSEGPRMLDKTEQGGRSLMKLPSEYNGHAMVFRVFDRVSYALILDSRFAVKIGDKLISPE